MKIKIDQIEYVANLARISLTDDEGKIFTKQLGAILKYIEKLNQLDTKDIQPMSHALDMTNASRNDKIKDALSLKDALSNAPQTKENFFKVPRVI